MSHDIQGIQEGGFMSTLMNSQEAGFWALLIIVTFLTTIGLLIYFMFKKGKVKL